MTFNHNSVRNAVIWFSKSAMYAWFLFFSCGFAVGQSDSTKVDTSSSVVIRNIVIENGNVFPDSLINTNWAYSFANKFHTKSRKRILKKYMLSEVGDTLDWQYNAETERLLRRRDYITAAKVIVDTISKDSVDLIVKTQDAWSLITPLELSSGGGLYNFGLGIEEHNLLGFGKTLFLYSYYESDIGYTNYVGYDDELLFGTRWSLNIEYEKGVISEGIEIELEKPFFYSNDKWAYGSYLKLKDEKERIFSDGAQVFSYNRHLDRLGFYFSRSFGKRYAKWRSTIQYVAKNDTYSSTEENGTILIPEDESINLTSLSITKENLTFTKERYINKFHVIEDFRVGSLNIVTIGKGALFGEQGLDRFEVNLYRKQRFQLKKSMYLMYSLRYNYKEDNSKLFKFKIRYYYRVTKHQTLAFNLNTFIGSGLELHNEFILGGNSGLRGYKARLFRGSKLFLVNIEDRLFAPFEFAGIGFGAVLFTDFGYVWKESTTPQIEDIKASAGLGLRIGFFTLPDSPVLRIDYGFPFDGSKPYITLGFEQQF